MQISETLSQELHKQFTVTYPVSELEGRVNARLEEMKPRINLKGFRPGKAPVSFLKKQFGRLVSIHKGFYDSVPITSVTSEKKVVDVQKYYNTDRLRPIYDFDGAPLFIMTSD